MSPCGITVSWYMRVPPGSWKSVCAHVCPATETQCASGVQVGDPQY